MDSIDSILARHSAPSGDSVDAILAKHAPTTTYPWERPEPEDRIGRANRLDREASQGLDQARAADTSQQPSTAHAVLGGVLSGATANTFPMITAAITHPISVLPGGDRSAYTTERDDLQHAIEQDRSAHPYAFGAGDLAGTAATAALLPGATALQRIAVSTGLSGASTAGESLSKGESFGTAAKKGAIGAGVGAALGGVGELVAKGLGSAVGKFATKKPAEEETVDNILRDFVGEARPKDRKPARELFNREIEKQPIASPTISQRDVLLRDDFKPLIDDLRSTARTDKEAAIEKIQNINNRLNAQKLPLAQKIDQAKQFPVGNAVNDLDTTIFKLKGETGSKPVVKALSEARDSLMETWASVPAETLRTKLGNFPVGKLTDTQEAAISQILANAPEGGFVTRGQLTTLLGDHVEDAKIRSIVEDLPFKFHAEAPVPYAEIRQATTNAQESAIDTLGTIAETEHAKLKQAISSNINRSLEKHLNSVAQQSPELAETVTNLRNGDVVQSATLSLKRGLESALNTGADKSLSLKGHVGNVGANVVAGEQVAEAAMSAASGNGTKAVLHLGTAAAAKIAPKAVAGIKAGAKEASARAAYNNRGVQKLLKAVAEGNPRAVALAKKLKLVVPDNLGQAAKTAGVVNAVPHLQAAAGQVADGFLGQGDNQ